MSFGAEFLPLPVNVGPGGARNAGLALVETEFVVFLDSDLEINTETIPLLLRHFADPRVAMAVSASKACNMKAAGLANMRTRAVLLI